MLSSLLCIAADNDVVVAVGVAAVVVTKYEIYTQKNVRK